MPAAKRPPSPDDAGEGCPEVKRHNSVQFEPHWSYHVLECSEPILLEDLGHNHKQLHIVADACASVVLGVRDQSPFQATLAMVEGCPLPEGVTLHPRGKLVVIPPGHESSRIVLALKAQHTTESRRRRTWRVVVCVETEKVLAFHFLVFFDGLFC